MSPEGAVIAALAYSISCGPLPDDVQSKVTAAMEAMKPDKQWMMKKAAEDFATRLVVLGDFPPSMQARIAEMNNVTAQT